MRLQPGGPGTLWAGVAAGWHCFADRIEAYLDGLPPDFDHPGLCRAYAEHLSEHWSGSKRS